MFDRQRTVKLFVGCGGEAQRGPRRWCRPAAMGAAVAADLGQLAGRVHTTEILTTVSFHDHPRLEGGGRLACPGEEFLPVAAECDFDQMRHSGKATR